MGVYNTPDGPVNFPDTMSDEQVRDVLRKKYPPTSAQPQQMEATEPQKGTGSPLAVPGEIAAAGNRAVMDTLDFFGPGSLNAAARLSNEYLGTNLGQLPTFAGAFEENVPGAQGGFMDEGTGRDVAQGFGSALPAAASLAQVPRNLATAGGYIPELLGLGTQKAPGVAQAASQVPGMAGDLRVPTARDTIERADQLGWPLSFGDRTGSRTVKAIESAIESTPMPANPMHRINDQRQKILQRTAAESVGLPSDARLTPDVVGDVASGLSDEFTQLQNLDALPVNEQFVDDLLAVQDNAKTRLFRDPQINDTVDKVFDKIDDSGSLGVPDYQDMTSELKAKIRQAWKGESPDPYFAESLSDIVDALDDLSANNMDPQALSQLKRARAKWKALSQLEKSRAIHESGDISGPLLGNYLRRTDKGGYGRGGNTSELYEAARMSKAFPSRPDSGTAGRMYLQNLMNNPLGGLLSLGVSPLTSTLANAFVRGPSGASRLARSLAGPQYRVPLAAAGRTAGGWLEDEEQR